MALKSPFDDGPCTVKFLTFDGTSWTEIFSALLAANSTSSDFTYSGYGATNTARFVVTPDGIVQLQGDDTVDGGARGPAARCAIRIIPSVAIPSSPSAQAQYIGALSTTSNDFTSTAFFFGVWNLTDVDDPYTAVGNGTAIEVDDDFSASTRTYVPAHDLHLSRWRSWRSRSGSTSPTPRTGCTISASWGGRATTATPTTSSTGCSTATTPRRAT